MVELEQTGLSLRRQCELLGLPRSSWYYRPCEVRAEDLALMRRMDEVYLDRPYFGSRRMAAWLRAEGEEVNRKRVQRLMRVMGLEGMAPGPRTSRPHPEHRVYPYLLRGLDVVRADQVWAADITYIPLERGWAYLVAIMDWFSRAVLAWRTSNSLTVGFCVEALQEALRGHGRPDIFNTDQGAQFSSQEFTGMLDGHGVRISMDGRRRCRDNIFVERLWRSLKYEEVYLKAYDDVRVATEGIGEWFDFYNRLRPHQSFGYRTPMQVYVASLAEARRAA